MLKWGGRGRRSEWGAEVFGQRVRVVWGEEGVWGGGDVGESECDKEGEDGDEDVSRMLTDHTYGGKKDTQICAVLVTVLRVHLYVARWRTMKLAMERMGVECSLHEPPEPIYTFVQTPLSHYS